MANNTISEVVDWLEDEINSLKKEIDNRSQTIDKLENLISGLREFESFEEYKNKYDVISDEFEKEKERLVKLHNHYRQMEGEYGKLRQRLDNWEDWYSENKEIFIKLFSNAPPGLGMEEGKS